MHRRPSLTSTLMERRYQNNDVITTSGNLGGEPGLTDVIDVNGINNWSDFIE